MSRFKINDIVVSNKSSNQVEDILTRNNILDQPLTITRTDRNHFYCKELPSVEFCDVGFTYYALANELAEQSRRQAIIAEVTDACEVFEKYGIRRSHSLNDVVRYHTGRSAEDCAQTHKSVAELCIHLSPCRLKVIQKLKATIAEAQSELDSITGAGPCK